MNINTIILLGLQLPHIIDKREINDILYAFNQKLIINNFGKIHTATLHKKNGIKNEKTILIISINPIENIDLDVILKHVPLLKNFKHLLITSLNETLTSKNNIITFEQFIKFIDESKLIYFPANIKPQCILKAMYQHYFCLSGDIIWHRGKLIHIDIGKYYARQLYCETFVDCIKTNEGYKVPANAIIHVTNEDLLPQYQNTQVVLHVLEEKNKNSYEEVLNNQYKVALN